MKNTIANETKLKIINYVKAESTAKNVQASDLNKTAIASKFNVSARTVGRIIASLTSTSPVAAAVKSTTPKKEKQKASGTKTQKVVADKKLDELAQLPIEKNENTEKLSVDVVVNSASKKADVKVVSWTVTQNSVLLTLSDGNNASITKDNKNYATACKELLSGNTDIMSLVNQNKAFEYEYGNVKVSGDDIIFAGKTLPKDIGFFVIDAIRSGDQNQAIRLTKFLNNLLENPSYRAVNTLYRFVKHNDIVIDDDGMLLAWKRITANFKDVYTKTIDNSIGNVVEVRRNEVEEDPNKTCARGLHLCAKSYLSSYSGAVIVQCLLNPRDVVAVPTDYNGAKLRCCRYKVLKDVTKTFNISK